MIVLATTGHLLAVMATLPFSCLTYHLYYLPFSQSFIFSPCSMPFYCLLMSSEAEEPARLPRGLFGLHGLDKQVKFQIFGLADELLRLILFGSPSVRFLSVCYSLSF